MGHDPHPDLLTAYLQLAASRGMAMPARALRDRLGDKLDALLALGAANEGRPLSRIVCQECFEGHTALVEYDEINRCSWIFCPEAGRVIVDDGLLATVQPRLQWLPDQLAAALRVRPSPPRRTLIDGAAWWLGDTAVRQTEVSVALALDVRSTAEIQQLTEKLQRRPPLGPGLLLVAGDLVSAPPGDLTGYQPIPIEEIVRADGEAIVADQARLEAWVRATLRGQARPKSRRGGRPSVANQVMLIFRQRRQRGEAFVNKSTEAKAILDEWLLHFPDQDPPALPTMRAQLPAPVSQQRRYQ